MKILYVLIALIFLKSCSFDDKTGIWNSEQSISKKNDIYKEFKTFTLKEEQFNEIIPFNKNFNFKLSEVSSNINWNDPYYGQGNNLDNFLINGLDNISLKSKKLTRNNLNQFLLHDENNLIINDNKGNVIVYSIIDKEIISKFNFYKKKYKKFDKKLNLLVENKIIYINDNIGYFYAYDYKNNKIIWAKNLNIPLRSNIKIYKDNLFLSNQDNSLLVFDKRNGNLIKEIPTEETILKNQFINNISSSKSNILFLNSYGSLYSIDIEDLKLNWFLNLNQSFETNSRNIFDGIEVISHKDTIIISSNYVTFIINANSGNILRKFNFSSKIAPIINNNLALFFTKNNLLIAVNLKNNQIIYSYNVIDQLNENVKFKKNINFIKMFLANDQILLISNSHVLKFDINGKFKSFTKLSNKMNSQPIIVNKSILYLNNRNKLIVLN